MIAKSFARIHWRNLDNFGILPLVFSEESQYDELGDEAVLTIDHPAEQLQAGETIRVEAGGARGTFEARHQLSPRQVEVLCAGGLINWSKQRSHSASGDPLYVKATACYRRVIASTKS